jgi:hypothetical protein
VNEPQIACPNCGHEIKLTESLAAPLIEATRKQFQQQLANKDAEVARERAVLRQQQDELAKARETIEDQVVARLKTERAAIAAAEAKKAKDATANEIDSKTKQLSEMQQLLDQNNIKLAEAQKAQADMLKKQRDLDEKLREADLTVQKRVQDEVATIHVRARKDAEEVFPFESGGKGYAACGHEPHC